MKKTSLSTRAQYIELGLQQTPMIDVRAAIEFAKGALPYAVNLPFINDEERHLIGICYKEKGQQAAIDLGHQLVNGHTKNSRIEAWQQFLEQHPNAVLYCARGGLRSELSQQRLLQRGIECPRIDGGFKAMRTFLLQYLDETCATAPFTLLSGMTGTGKTDIIKLLHNSVDLEGHANHKGSSFGRPLNEQPTQIDFENNLISALLRVRQNNPNSRIILEDESRNIGGIHLPPVLSVAMANSSVVVIDSPLEERIEKLWHEYVVQRYQETVAYHKARENTNHEERAAQAFSDYLIDSLLRVQRRLGSQRTNEILALMNAAIKHQHSDSFASHKHWLRAITVDYYDPMYLYQLNKRKNKVLFTGDHQSVTQWLQENIGKSKLS